MNGEMSQTPHFSATARTSALTSLPDQGTLHDIAEDRPQARRGGCGKGCPDCKCARWADLGRPDH